MQRSRHGAIRRRLDRLRPAVALALATVLAAGAPGTAAARALPSQRIWQFQSTQQTPSVPGSAGVKPTATVALRRASSNAAKPFHPAAAAWPAGSATVGLNPARRAATRAGALPIRMAPADAATAPSSSVTVTVAARDGAAKAGVSGVVFTVDRADSGAAATDVDVTLDYSSFASAFGGGYGDRLKLVRLPACALTTPAVAACRTQTPVASHNDSAHQTLTARVEVAAAGAAPAASAGTRSAVTGTQHAAARQAVVLAATSSPGGSVGTYTATSLASSGTWSAGGESGDFTYDYPIALPPGPGGAPGVSLSYDSGSVDGRTSATNAQASWIGDGWDYTPGFVERSYQSCNQDGIANSGDQCWAGNQLNLSLGAHSSTIVRDDATGAWHLQRDDGTRIIPLTGENNGAYNGEAWEAVTPDGVQYYFGLGHLPTTANGGAATGSAWTEPVYCPKSGDGPAKASCYNSSTGTNSFAANMGWRWNLDYVVDPHGNLQTYTWTPEGNYYDRGYAQGNGTGTSTGYVRGGYLSSIGYGYRLSDAIAGAKPYATVTFNVLERCLTSSTFSNCASTNLTSATAVNWPDVPFDQICATQTATCANYSPTFFSTKRLTSISTAVLAGSSYSPVDTYTLTQMFPAPQAGVVEPSMGASPTNPGDGTVAVMWLNSIQRTGQDTLGGGGAVTMPPVTFTAEMMANRVDGATTGAAALFRPRMDYYTTEAGAEVLVGYADPQCSRVNNTMPASEDSDTLACFPQYWVPTAGTSPVLDWFNKYQVASVTVTDPITPKAAGGSNWSEAQVTSYKYGPAAWHRDDSPLTPSAQRTWDQFRGYRTVTTTTGVASAVSVPTQTVTTYLLGMDGDYLKNGTQRSVSVSDSVGDSVTDSPWLQGTALETQALLGVGGQVLTKSVGGPWSFTTTAAQAQADSMPALVARMTATSQSRQYLLQHDGTWKKSQTVAAFDASGRQVQSDVTADGRPEVCTTTAYAQDTSRNMLAFPDHVTAVAGHCGTAPSAATTVGDSRVFYDSSSALGALTGPGDPTTVDAVDSYSGGSPVYAVQKTEAFDAYGRVTSSTDADQHTTTTAFSTPGTSPDTVTTVNPAQWTSTETLDPARSLDVASTDANGELTSRTYDGLGRATAVWSPLNSKAAGANPDDTYTYRLDGANPPAVTTSTLEVGGTYYSTDAKLYDASLRVIQDQTATANGGPSERNLTDTHYNSLGQTVKTTNAYYDGTAAPGTTLSVPANDTVIPGETEVFYDGDGRVAQSLFVADGVNQWATTTAYRGTDATDVTPPAGGTATSSYSDIAGRVTSSWRYNTPTPTGNASDAIVTATAYDAAGRTATVADNAGNTWTYAYDLHGRQTKVSDPRSGTATASYSPGGMLLSTTDGRNRQLSYDYDALGRKTAEYDATGNAGKSTADTLATWTYDTLEKGQLTSDTRYSAGSSDAAHAYTEAVQGYTADYKPTGETVTVPSAEGTLAGTYQSTNQYDATTGVQVGQHYVAERGLPKEQVNLTYTPGGVLNGFGGSYVYANQITYNSFGQVLSSNFGVYGKQLSRTETYDPPTGRLLSVSDGVQTTSSTALDTTSFTYDQSGAETSQSTTQPATGANDTQCFTYDQQERLTAAWTDTAGVNSSTNAPGVQVFGLGGCADTAPAAGKVTGGPAPYWDSYGYDSLGDRVTATNHDTSVTGHAADVTQTLAYNGYNAATGLSTAAATPDAVQSVTSASASGSTTSGYQYDGAGNTTARAGQTLTYDAEGRTQSVTNTGNNTTSSYTYAADGTLLLQHDPATTTLYLPYGEEITLATGSGTVSALRYYAASPDGVTLVRSSAGTLAYELGDTRKTATTSVDAATLAATVRYTDPYGNPRGAVPASWPDQHGYLGKPADAGTGLNLLGARDYDPATGRFMSVDPVFEAGDPAQMGGYAYAGDEPVSAADPTGLSKCDADAGLCPGSGSESSGDANGSDGSGHYCDGCDHPPSGPSGDDGGTAAADASDGVSSGTDEPTSPEDPWWKVWGPRHDTAVLMAALELSEECSFGGGCKISIDQATNMIPGGSSKSSSGKNPGYADVMMVRNGITFIWEVKNAGGPAEAAGPAQLDNYIKKKALDCGCDVRAGYSLGDLGYALNYANPDELIHAKTLNPAAKTALEGRGLIVYQASDEGTGYAQRVSLPQNVAIPDKIRKYYYPPNTGREGGYIDWQPIGHDLAVLGTGIAAALAYAGNVLNPATS